MSTDESLAARADSAPTASRVTAVRKRLRVGVGASIVWLAGAAVVICAQPSSDRRLAATGAALAGIAAILLVRMLTPDPARSYLRSLLAGILAVAVTADWGVRQGVHNLPGLTFNPNNAATTFFVAGEAKRIMLPLVVVLLAPLVLQSLFGERRLHAVWQHRVAVLHEARGMDWILFGYCVLAVPALMVGLAHHNSLTYVAQDLGLVVVFVFMYVAGRAADADAAAAFASELVNVLLLVAVGTVLLFPWGLITGLFAYIEATAAGALAFLIVRPTSARLLPLGVAAAFLIADVISMRNGTSSSTTTLGLLAALGILAYLALRVRRLVPPWILVAAAVVVVIGLICFTHDGAALRGQYHGSDPSNRGRTYEAKQVRAEARGSPVALALGRGFGGTIDETRAPLYFRQALVQAGRDLTHVQEIHLLAYSILLKTGFLGLAWLAGLVVGLAALVVRALERAARTRDPALVVYAALAGLGVAAAFGGASNLQANPLNALTLGLLVTCLAPRPAVPAP